MIFDALVNHKLYLSLGYNLPVAFKFLMENDLDALPVGRIDLDGDRLYALIQQYISKQPFEAKWEAHRKYIDIQYMHSGRELMGFANLRSMVLGEYSAEKDYQSMTEIDTGTGNTLEVGPGQFVIFFPEDAHKPGIAVEQKPEPIKKVVLKIKI